MTKLYKDQNSGRLYVNQKLYEFINKCSRSTTGELVEGDKIFFFTNVDFKRDRLNFSNNRYYRTIKVGSADAVIVDPSFYIPAGKVKYLLHDNKIVDTQPDFHSAIQDVLYDVTMMNIRAKDVIEQYYSLSQLPSLPKIISVNNLVNFVNSGLVICEENFYEILDLLQANPQAVYPLIDSCDFNKSKPFLLFLVYRHNFEKDTRLMVNLSYLYNILNNIASTTQLSESNLDIITSVPFLKERITRMLIDRTKLYLESSAIPKCLANRITVEEFNVVWNDNR